MLNKSETETKLKMLNEFEKQIDEFYSIYQEKLNLENLFLNFTWFIKTWNMSRMDIKNIGNESNTVRIFEKDIRYERNLYITFPDWLKNNEGQGCKVEYENQKMKIVFQSVNNGTLKIEFRGIDYQNIFKERKPVYINLTKITLNNDNYLKQQQVVWHDEPYIISRRTHNRERINLEVKCKTIFHYFPQLNNFFKNIENMEDFENNYDRIKEYLISERKYIEKDNIENEVHIDSQENPTSKEIKSNLAMFGSCVSIDPFRSCYNDYKKDFNKKYEHQRSSIISLMSPKIDCSPDDLIYLKDTHDKNIVTNDIRKDFGKDIFYHLDGIDYLIINLVHDIRWGVLSYEDTYITNSGYIRNTNFYINNKDKLRPINMLKNEDEYYEIWTKSCDNFFKYLSENYPNIKVILQKIEFVANYITFEGTFKCRKDFHKQAVTFNPFFKKLESYIENNFDVEIIDFPPETCAEEGNIWGLYSTHYTKSYYNYVYDKIRIIDLENKLEKYLK